MIRKGHRTIRKRRMAALVVGGTLASLAALSGGGSSLAHAAPPECRDIPFKYGDENQVVRMCRGADGKWQEVSQSVSGERNDPAPEVADQDARAEVEYRGTFDQTMTFPSSRGINLNNPLGSLLNNALNKRIEQAQGAYTISAQLNGAVSTAIFSGTGLQTINASGTAIGGYCRFFGQTEAGTTVKYEGRCGPRGFSGTMTGTSESGVQLKGRFETTTTKFVNLAAKETLQASARAEVKNNPTSSGTDNAISVSASNSRRTISTPQVGISSGANREQNFDPLSESGDRDVNPTFTYAYDIPQSALTLLDQRLKNIGLPKGNNYFYSYRKFFLTGYKEFYYIFWICDQNNAGCKDGTLEKSPNVAVVNFKRNEYVLTVAIDRENLKVCIDSPSLQNCRVNRFRESDAEIYRRSFLGIGTEAMFFYNYSHIRKDSDLIIKQCIRESSRNDSQTYRVLANNGYGWVPTGGTQTVFSVGITFKNVCNRELYILTKSNQTGSRVETLGKDQTFETIITDVGIELYALSSPPPPFWS